MKKQSALFTAVFMVLVLAAPAFAEEKKSDRPGGARIEAVSVSAVVEAIDHKKRIVTLKGPKGGVTTFIAGDEVRNLAQLKKGDVVTFDYSEGLAIDVRKATEAPKMTETQSITRAKPGEKPGGTIETVGMLTARVEAIDYKTRKVTLSLPEGQNLEMTASDEVKRLNEVKKGDEVAVQYMQKLTIRVTTPKKN